MSWQLGRHTLKFGGQWLRYQQNRYYSANDGGLGWFIYQGRASGSVADPWTDFLQNKAFSFGQGAVTGRWGQRQWRDALFVQDDFKMMPNLTLNLGLRWEWDQPMYEVNNKVVNVDLTTGAIQYAGQNGNSRALYHAYWGGFMPRIGFAYTPERFNGRFVVRGGFGMTNFLEGTGANLRLTLKPPFFIDSSSVSNGDAALTKAFNFTESKHLDFRADFFNVLNTTSLAPPTNNVSGNIGLITNTVSTERQIQLALKLVF